MKKYKWNNPCPCAGGDWQRETRQSLHWPLKPWGLHRSFLRRHPSWRRLGSLTSTPVIKVPVLPTTIFMSPFHTPGQLPSFSQGHERWEGKFSWFGALQVTEHGGAFSAVYMQWISEKEAKPLWSKDGSLLGSQAKNQRREQLLRSPTSFPTGCKLGLFSSYPTVCVSHVNCNHDKAKSCK